MESSNDQDHVLRPRRRVGARKTVQWLGKAWTPRLLASSHRELAGLSPTFSTGPGLQGVEQGVRVGAVYLRVQFAVSLTS